MTLIEGKYADAKVFASVLEDEAAEQIRTLCDQPFVQGSRIRVMPDVHAGAGCTIGTTMTVTDKLVPNLVGVDIGCGMETVKLAGRRLELQKLDKVIRERIPAGMAVRDTPHPLAEEIDLTALRCYKAIHPDRAVCSVGTLGGGNHFIEVDEGEDGSRYLIVHSGSRRLGVEVAEYYQEAGWKVLSRVRDEEREALIARYKAEGRERELSSALNAQAKAFAPPVPRTLAYVEGALFEDYLHDMAIVQRFASLNRQAMVREILRGMKLDAADAFTTIHNYIDIESGILRKGAVSAKAGERLLIPINMRDGSLLCAGKGNEDWNCSAPHGAGRLMSRAAARNSFTVSAFKKEMAGVYTTSVGKDTLDECPMAYKRLEDILPLLGETAEVTGLLRPVYNFKAGSEERAGK